MRLKGNSKKIFLSSVPFFFLEKQNLSKYPRQNVNIHLNLAVKWCHLVLYTSLEFKIIFLNLKKKVFKRRTYKSKGFLVFA